MAVNKDKIKEAYFEKPKTTQTWSGIPIKDIYTPEDVDVIGLSTHCGEYRTYVPRIKKLMRERALDHVLFLVGGVIPVDKIDEIKGKGADEVFPPGVSVKSITQYLRTALENRRS